jgi:hypothetical protein
MNLEAQPHQTVQELLVESTASRGHREIDPAAHINRHPIGNTRWPECWSVRAQGYRP